MKILFINPCLRPGARAKYPPVGLAYIMHAASRAGYEYDFLDLDLNEMDDSALEKALLKEKYDIIGVGCIVTGLPQVVRIANLARKTSPNALIIAGNSVATSIPEMLLRKTDIDIAVLGEGDITIVELLDAIANKSDWRVVPGIAFIENDRFVRTTPRKAIANLDDIGFPDWGIFNISEYNRISLKETTKPSESGNLLPLNGARGCPFNCTFCYHVFKTYPYRKYSESVIMEEFVRLSEVYNATLISFWDELSFPDISSVERMSAALEKLPFRTAWQATTRGNLFRAEHLPQIKRLKEAGCVRVAFSIENASKEILLAMNKKIDHRLTLENALALHKGGITPVTSIIFGYPQETPGTIADTLNFCKECGIFPSTGFLLPLPGTPIYEQAKAMGIIQDEWNYLLNAGDRQDFYINMASMPDDEFQSCVYDGLQELAQHFGLHFENPLKTGVYQKVDIDAVNDTPQA